MIDKFKKSTKPTRSRTARPGVLALLLLGFGLLLPQAVSAQAQATRALQAIDFVALEGDRVLLTLTLSEPAPEPVVFTIDKPARLSLDLPDTRIALAERGWELASLRVLGFTRAEVSALLLGELAIVIAAALPLGMALGFGLVHLISGLLASDQFYFPVVILPRTYAWAALCVLAAGVVSALVVRRRIDTLDMVAVLKTRE